MSSQPALSAIFNGIVYNWPQKCQSKACISVETQKAPKKMIILRKYIRISSCIKVDTIQNFKVVYCVAQNIATSYTYVYAYTYMLYHARAGLYVSEQHFTYVILDKHRKPYSGWKKLDFYAVDPQKAKNLFLECSNLHQKYKLYYI